MDKQYITWLSLILAAIGFNSSALANTVSADIAMGVQFSDGDALFLKYKPKSFEYHVGMWDGDNRNMAVGVGYPLERQGKVRFGWTPGFAMVSRETDILGTHWQFYNEFRLRYSDGERLQFDLGWIHYSNGSRVFHHDHTPNRGENFIKLLFRYDF